MMPGILRALLAIPVLALPAIAGRAPLQAQEPSVGGSHCGFLNITKKELSSALKECGVFTPFFQPDKPASRPASKPAQGLSALGLRGGEAPMLFGQGRFVQRFPLYLHDLYPPQAGDGGGTDPSSVKQAALGGTVRGGMIEDNTDDIGQPTVRAGTVTWAARPRLLGPDSTISEVSGNLTIEGHEVAMSLAISPAEAGGLMIEIKLRGEDGAELGVPRIRQTGDRSGEPMDVVGRRRAAGEFIFVPAADQQALRNITGALLKGQWIDVPVRPKGEITYTLTMELARPGKALMRRAFESWRLPGP